MNRDMEPPNTVGERTPYAFDDLGIYMMLADASLNILSVFDDLKYDRADADMLSPGMRIHAVEKLKPRGFKQTSGSVLYHKADDVFCYLPKPQTLGASPFDAMRYTPKRPQDYVVLTPTQTACQYIDVYSKEVAFEKMIALVQRQPINLLRLADYLEKKPAHEEIFDVLGEVRGAQRAAVESEPLRRRRAPGSPSFRRNSM